MRAALDLSQGRGLVAVNVMKAVRDHPALVRQACESGAHAIVMGAGLPMDLPEMTAIPRSRSSPSCPRRAAWPWC